MARKSIELEINELGSVVQPRLHDGRLADLAPTLLALMDLPQPAEMTGRSLIG